MHAPAGMLSKTTSNFMALLFCLCWRSSKSKPANPCTEQVLLDMRGEIKWMHTSNFVVLSTPNSSNPTLIAKFPTVGHPTNIKAHFHDHEYELLAYAIDLVLRLGVRPTVRPFLALRKNNGSDMMMSLAMGKGLEALKSSEVPCLRALHNNDIVPVVAMDYISGLSDMQSGKFRLHASNKSVTSAANVHFLYEILGAHNDRERKNCFIDSNGQFWALDIGHVTFAHFFQERHTVLACLSRVADLRINELKCKAWNVIANKILGLDLAQVENSMHKLLKAHLLPGVTYLRGDQSSASIQSTFKQCLAEFFFPGASRRIASMIISDCLFKSSCLHGFLSNSTIYFFPDKVQRQTTCVLDLSAIWAKIIRVRLSEYASMLRKKLSYC